jgi:hypothetical protein
MKALKALSRIMSKRRDFEIGNYPELEYVR